MAGNRVVTVDKGASKYVARRLLLLIFVDLCIYTAAADKSLAAVTSTTNLTVVTNLEQLVLGDRPLINVTFTNGSTVPAWAGGAGYTLRLGLGLLDVNGLAAQTDAATTTAITGGWSTVLDLTTQQIIDAMALQVGSAVDWTRFPFTSRMPGPRPNGGWFTMQISVKQDSTGYGTTYAELRVYLRNRVLTS